MPACRSCSPKGESLDRHDGTCTCAGVSAADEAAARARRGDPGHLPRLRPDAAAAGLARDRGGGDRKARRPVAVRQSALDGIAPADASPLGEGTRLRHRARPRLARADDDRAALRHPERDDVRLRVRLAAAPARLPGGHEGRRTGLDPAGAPGQVRDGAAQAPAVPRSEGGVLPGRLRAGPLRPRALRARSFANPRRRPHAARRLALQRSTPRA